MWTKRILGFHRFGVLVEVLPPKWLCQTQGCVLYWWLLFSAEVVGKCPWLTEESSVLQGEWPSQALALACLSSWSPLFCLHPQYKENFSPSLSTVPSCTAAAAPLAPNPHPPLSFCLKCQHHPLKTQALTERVGGRNYLPLLPSFLLETLDCSARFLTRPFPQRLWEELLKWWWLLGSPGCSCPFPSSLLWGCPNLDSLGFDNNFLFGPHGSRWNRESPGSEVRGALGTFRLHLPSGHQFSGWYFSALPCCAFLALQTQARMGARRGAGGFSLAAGRAVPEVFRP